MHYCTYTNTVLTHNKKNRLKVEGKYSYNPSENTLGLFHL